MRGALPQASVRTWRGGERGGARPSSLPMCSPIATSTRCSQRSEGNGAESRTDQELRDGLRAARAAAGAARVAALKPIFLTDKNTPRRSVCSKGLRQAEPQLCAALDRAQSRLRHARDRNARSLLAPRQARRCSCSPTPSRQSMRAPKRARPCSTMTTSSSRRRRSSRAPAPRRGCCSRSTEAWTTSSLTRRRIPTRSNGRSSSAWPRSFSPAKAQASKRRTLFAVGDEKQSIYSFQGADPVRFGAVGRTFRAKAMAIEHVWNDVPLTLSFRSTEAVLAGGRCGVQQAPRRGRTHLR